MIVSGPLLAAETYPTANVARSTVRLFIITMAQDFVSSMQLVADVIKVYQGDGWLTGPKHRIFIGNFQVGQAITCGLLDHALSMLKHLIWI